MNLFWDTRRLTQEREDHLTCFLAACLEADGVSRRAYETQVLAALARDGAIPEIGSVETQVGFPEQHSRPDMMLVLNDGRRVACEHKIGAPDALQIAGKPQTPDEAGRYLKLPGIDHVAYFRSSLTNMTTQVLAHTRYVRPPSAPHFLWRDLHDALCAGKHVLTGWLCEGFDKLGFTPPHPDIGELWPTSSQQVIDNQENFGKLWHSTRGHLASSYSTMKDTRMGLYLTPRKPGAITLANVGPGAQHGSLLRLRVHTDEGNLPEVQRRLEEMASTLPVPAEMTVPPSSLVS